MLKIYLFLIILRNVDRGAGYMKISPVEDNIIISTDAKVRDTLNEIVKNLHIQTVIAKDMQRYLSIHNHLMAVTLQSYDVLKEIVKLTNAKDKGNVTDDLNNEINIVNETLFDNTIHRTIKDFLVELDYFKSRNGKDIILDAFIQNEIVLNGTDQILEYEVEIDESSDAEVNNEFWVPKNILANSRRIYQGENARIKMFPFLAVILVFKQFYCAGSIISADLVITAASCLQIAWKNKVFRENPTFLTVRVGTSYFAAGGDVIAVKKIHFHPNFDSKTLKDNLCILQLARQLDFSAPSKKVKKVEIDKSKTILSPKGDGVTIIGWGAKNHASTFLTLVEPLAFDRLDIYSLEDCQDIYSKDFVKENNFCAGFITKGGGACNHDVGAPGIVNGILTGIVTFGSPVCGTPDAPTVFTKIGFYAEWIENIMNKPQSTVKKPKMTTEIIKKISHGKKSSKSDKKQTSKKIENDDELYLSFVRTLQAKDLMEVFKANNDSKESFEQDSSQKQLDREEKKKQVLLLLKDLAQSSVHENKHKHQKNHDRSHTKKSISNSPKTTAVLFEDALSSKEFMNFLKGKLLESVETSNDVTIKDSAHKLKKSKKEKIIKPKVSTTLKFKHSYKKERKAKGKYENIDELQNDTISLSVEHDIITQEIKKWIREGLSATVNPAAIEKKLFKATTKSKNRKSKIINYSNYDSGIDDSDSLPIIELAENIRKHKNKQVDDLRTAAFDVENTNSKKKVITRNPEVPVNFDYYENFYVDKLKKKLTEKLGRSNKTDKRDSDSSDDSSDYYGYGTTEATRATERLHFMYANNIDNVMNYITNNSSDSTNLGSYVKSIYYKGGSFETSKNNFRANNLPSNNTEISLTLSINDQDEDSRKSKSKNELLSKELLANAFRNWLDKNANSSAFQTPVSRKTDDELFQLLQLAIDAIENDKI